MADSSKKPSELLKEWPAAVIDPEGTFKYVLIEAYATDPKNPDQEHSKLLVRGNRSAEYHANAYDDAEELLRAKGLDCQCLGKLRDYYYLNFKMQIASSFTLDQYFQVEVELNTNQGTSTLKSMVIPWALAVPTIPKLWKSCKQNIQIIPLNGPTTAIKLNSLFKKT